MGTVIGYARVFTEDLMLRMQVDQLEEAGASKVFTDVASGADSERPGLDEALTALEDGDTLLVWRLDRLGRSPPHLVDLVNEIAKRMRPRPPALRTIGRGFTKVTPEPCLMAKDLPLCP